MSGYALDTFAQAIYDKIEPFTRDDARYGYALAIYLASVGVMFQDIDDIVAETDEGPSWSAVMDINRVPADGIGWLAQFVGASLDPGLADADQRVRVANTDGFKRGSPDAMKAAAAGYLTGTKTVIFRERHPDAYSLAVVTYSSETPDSSRVLAALLEQKPGGIKLTYTVNDGQDYQSLLDNHPTYANVYADYATYQGIVTDLPGT